AIDQATHIIRLVVPQGTNLTTLAPPYTLSSGTGVPASGSTQNFTNPVQYTITDGAVQNVYTVTAISLAVTASTANLAPSAQSITISGSGFDPVAGNNTVTFGNGAAAGTVTAATAT